MTARHRSSESPSPRVRVPVRSVAEPGGDRRTSAWPEPGCRAGPVAGAVASGPRAGGSVDVWRPGGLCPATTARDRSRCGVVSSRARPPTSGCWTGAAPADWVHTDPWRVLRIQAEFVEGFGALAELGPAVSVFGSARTPAGTARSTSWPRPRPRPGRRPGYAVITGGGPGSMEAANKGAVRGRRRLGRARASSCPSSRA